jgi:hypothetical protein
MFPLPSCQGTGDYQHHDAEAPASVRSSRAIATGGRRPRTAMMLASLGACAALLITALTAPASAGVAPDDPGPPSIAATPGAEAEDRNCGVSKTLVPECGSWWGAFSLNEGSETPADAIRSLESITQERVDIVHYYFRDTQIFPPAWMIDLAREPEKKRILAINWKPEAYHTWAQTAAGQADWYIDQEAAYLRANFREPFFLTIHHEPEDEVIAVPGSGMEAKDYANMYRHVVDRLRSKGVDNAVFVMNYMGFQGWGLQDWFPDLYPGDDYVDWIAFDPYASSGLGDQERGFRFMLNSYWGISDWTGAYNYFTEHHPGMPIMLGEFGLGEKAGDPDWKAWFFHRIGARLADGRFPMLKALLYFDNRYAGVAGDVRIDSSTQAVESVTKLLDRRVWAPPP